jgi:hypothetical protein
MHNFKTGVALRHAFALLVIVMYAGCQPSSAPKSPTGGIQEIGKGTIAFYRWEQGQTVMIGTDIRFGSTSSGESVTGPPWVRKQEGSIAGQDGRTLAWRLEHKEGQKITCRLNGTDFDLEKGNLFLVKSSDGKIEIEQTSQDLSAVKIDSESFKDFVRKNPAVNELIQL